MSATTTSPRLDVGIVAAQIELTNTCPLACAECAYVHQTRPKGHMDFGFFTMLVDGCREAFGTINYNLNGLGEPLNYPQLAQAIRYIGQVSPASRIELFTSLVTSIRRAEEVAEALASVPNPVLLASTIHSYGVDGEIMTQAHHAGPVLSLFRKRFAGMSRIDFHVAMNRTKFVTDDMADAFTAGFLPIFGQEKTHIVDKLDRWLGFVDGMAGPGGYSDVTSPGVCDYPFKVLHVAWNGDVLICCTDDVQGELRLGTIKEPSDIVRIWQSDRYQAIRARHNDLDVKGLSPCDRCGRTAGYRTR